MPQKYPQKLCHFLRLGIILAMKHIPLTKNIYQNVHHINIEVLEKKKKKTYKNISFVFKYFNFIFQIVTNFRSNSNTCK
jgi:phosphate starvation-inducible membrane PsiE